MEIKEEDTKLNFTRLEGERKDGIWPILPFANLKTRKSAGNFEKN